MAEFYRVLYEPKMLRRWLHVPGENRHSVHFEPPDEWVQIHKTTWSTKPADYPLNCSVALFTPQALQEFLATPRAVRTDWILPVQGVHAYASAP